MKRISGQRNNMSDQVPMYLLITQCDFLLNLYLNEVVSKFPALPYTPSFKALRQIFTILLASENASEKVQIFRINMTVLGKI